jgi:uncharacterized sulfatase
MTGTTPNIIVFFTDQQRWDTCGCYRQTPIATDLNGRPLDITPNLDEMAAEGTLFRQAFTPQPVCGPARAVMQTGVYASETGCFTNAIALRPDADTVAKRLRAAGYEAGYIGKWHLASTMANRLPLVAGRVETDFRDKPVPPEYRGGFDDFWIASDTLEHTSHGYDGRMYDAEGNSVEMQGRYRADWLTDLAIDYLQTRTGAKPFFLFLSFIEPHQQNDRHTYEGPAGSKQRWGNYETPEDLRASGGDWRTHFPDYLGCVHSLDEDLGRIRRFLRESGQAENTILLFTSDHGCHFRTRNREYKRSCHENSIRIPLVACGPDFDGGGQRDELVSLVDVVPSILAAAGLDAPEYMRGRPLQQLAAGQADAWREEVYVEISEHEMARAIRTPRWKYAAHVPDEDGWRRRWSKQWTESYLYDLDADPHEQNNLIADSAFAGVRSELRQVLQSYMQEVSGEARIIPAS